MRSLIALVLVLAACTSAAPVVPFRSPGVSVVTLYYKLSHEEPWSASNNGDLPLGWLDQANIAIGSAGLHPLNVSQERTHRTETRTCFSSACPNLHALQGHPAAG